MSSKNLIKVSLIGLFSSVFVPCNLVYATENSEPVYSPEPQKEVHYNWGYGSPASGIPSDHFKAVFDQSGIYAKGDYFLQTFADDGVKVEVDGETKINRWTDYTGGIEKSLWLGVTDGQHSVKTSYYENVAGAAVFSDVVPFGSWLAYYYPNDSLSGMPTAAKVISTEKLSEKFPGSPAKGIGADHFSARYTTAKRISAGDYVLNLNADDGIRVYVDGKLVVDRWQKLGADRIKLTISDLTDAKAGEKDVHWIEVEYREDVLNGYVDVSLAPFPVLALKTGKEAHYNWGYGSPASGYPSDYFTADIDQSGAYAKGDYFLQTFADDGVKVEVDGETKINRWTDYTGGMEKALWLGVTEGQHTVKTRYLENVAAAGVFSDVVPFGSWLTYYYPNDSLSGMPTAAKVISTEKLSEKFPGSPAKGIGADHFSARYTTAKRISAGDYVLNLNADDGIRVYVDGKLVVDRWQKLGADRIKLTFSDRTDAKAGEKDVHWIEVEYREDVLNGYVDVSLAPFPVLSLKTGKEAHYNWGYGSPASGYPSDYFTADIDQSGTYAKGDYFLQTFADDGVLVEVDGETKINRWTDYTGGMEKALWLGVADGQHTVKTRYLENVAAAGVFSDVVPFGSWLAYYYPNDSLSGMPTTAKVISTEKLSEKFPGSPAEGIGADHFSARYTTAKRISAGDYVLNLNADDGIRVYVDGKLVVDRWKKLGADRVKLSVSDRTEAKEGEKDIHWIEVEYREDILNGYVDVSFSSLKEEMNDTWVGEFYPNRTFEGNPYIVGGNSASNKLSSINFNWNLASPFPEIPADNFSARFSKKVSLEPGSYLFTVNADDKVRVFLDNQVIMDYWTNNNYSKNRNIVYVSGGEHTLVVEYQEDILQARLSFDYEKISSNKLFFQSVEQVENNWSYGAPTGFPVDGFEAYFDQSRTLPSGDYFIETLADDRAITKVDGEVKIDNGDNAPGQVTQALLLNMKSGYHDITTNYYEKVDKAYIYSHILPLGNWVAYYYPNNTFSGQPITAKTISPSGVYNSLSENNALGSPVPGQVPVDNFSAVYRTAKRLPAGEYVIRSKADEKIKVYIDGQLAYDGWTPVDFSQEAVKVSISDRNVTNTTEKDIHWIEVQYSEQTGQSYLDFTIQPFQDVFASDQWVGMFYSNKTLSGNPYIVGGIGAEQQIKELNFDWGTGSPHNRLPADGFSAKFIKKAFYNSGLYQINVSADDGVRVYVDDQKIIDSWKEGINTSYSNFWLAKGNHEIVVEYYDLSSAAKLNVDLTMIAPESGMFVSSVKLPVYRSYEELADYSIHLTFYNPSYTRYFELGYGEIVNILEVKNYAARIQTKDGRVGWVHKDYLESNLTDDFWLVKEGRTLRSQADVKSSNIGYIPSFSKVYLINHVTTSGPDYTEWYYVQTESGQRGWIWGALSTSGNSGYNIIKYNFNQAGTVTNEVNIFTPLNTKANVTADQINAFINYKTGGKKTLMTGMGYAYLKAQEESGLNAIYLLAHSGLETGWGTSAISNTKYNFYGIGAIDSKPDEGAYNYSTPEGGIIAGASWISKNYPIRPGDTDDKIPYYQPTIDNMRNDNSWHQYASDEAWAAKIGYNAQEFYKFINKK